MLIGPHSRVHVRSARDQSPNRSHIPGRRRPMQRRMSRRAARLRGLLLVDSAEARVADGHDVLALTGVAVGLAVIRRKRIEPVLKVFPAPPIAMNVAMPLKNLSGMLRHIGANSAAQAAVVMAA